MNIQYKLNQMAHLFEMIATQLKSVVNVEFIQSIKTLKGNTQSSERVVIQKIRDVFKDLGLSYEEAVANNPRTSVMWAVSVSISK